MAEAYCKSLKDNSLFVREGSRRSMKSAKATVKLTKDTNAIVGHYNIGFGMGVMHMFIRDSEDLKMVGIIVIRVLASLNYPPFMSFHYQPESEFVAPLII